MRAANLARLSLSFALKPVAAGLSGVFNDCWAVAGKENAPTARQSRPVLITLIGFLSLHLFLSRAPLESRKISGGRISIVHGSAKSNIMTAGISAAGHFRT